MNPKVWKIFISPSGTDLLPVSLSLPAETLDQTSFQLPGGAYTTLRTYEGCKALRIQNHFTRLQETVSMAGHSFELNFPALRNALRALAYPVEPGKDLRFRLTVDLEINPGDIYIASEPLITPLPEAYSQGVAAITTELQRQLPKAKLTRFIARADKVRQSMPSGINEAVMVAPSGYLLEGLSSNFFAFLSGILHTADEGVLSGITRSLALDAAQEIGIPVNRTPVHLGDLPYLDEAFLTSASRGLLPLRQIDSYPIGPAAPGPMTQVMLAVFNRLLQRELEAL